MGDEYMGEAELDEITFSEADDPCFECDGNCNECGIDREEE
jgi:hypothetical protein